MSYAMNRYVFDPEQGHEGPVVYGTAVEPWHSLSPWYHADTPMPMRRGPKLPRRGELGQFDARTAVPLAGIAVGLFALAMIGARGAERHQRSLYANRRTRRNRRRRR
jgi:hypothetical protein